MVSVLGDYWFAFPKGKKLEIKLKDILENEVDEKYYLSDKAITGKLNTNFQTNKLESVIPNEQGIVPTICARDYKDPKCILESNSDDKFVNIKGKQYPITKNNENFIEWKQKGFLDSDCRAWKDDKFAGTITTNGKTKIAQNLKTQLCNELIASGKVKENDVINHSYTNGLCGKNPNSRQTLDDYIESTNGIMNTLTTRPDTLGVVRNYRIRKLTPKECFRLMGVKDEDFSRVAENQSNASLYHLAGDSIVVDVLMAIFKEMM